MLSTRELSVYIKAIASVVSEHVAKAFSTLTQRMDGLEKAVQEIPKINASEIEKNIANNISTSLPTPKKGEDGKSITAEDVAPMLKLLVEEKIKSIPAAKNGEDGKDADPELMKALIASAVEQIPKPKNGADGKSITVEDVAPMLEQLVEEKIKTIPAAKDGEDGKDGKDADPELVKTLVASAVEQLPKPKNGDDGKSVTVEHVMPLLALLVDEKIKSIPAAKDGENGKDADPEFIKQFVVSTVEQLPKPKNGEDGKSITVEDVAPMLEQLVDTKIKNIPAAKNGENGKDADPELIKELIASAMDRIPTPKNGKDGESVPLDVVQRMIDEAVAKTMAGIKMPQNGEPGRDAAHIEILPAINTEKNYSRGTYAKHLGGLFRSFETTFGMRGWECIVEGIADIHFEKMSDRKFNLQVVRSSGGIGKKEIALPVMIYRGVFTQGEYDVGDTVTWAGSLWHCDAPTTDKPGEAGSKGWTLCAKKGRDGKDGKNGKDLVKGVSLS